MLGACSSDEGEGSTEATGATGPGLGGSGGAGGGGVTGGAAGSTSSGGGSATGGGGGSGGVALPAQCARLDGLDNCGWQSRRATFRDVKLLIVMDKSASMDEALDSGLPRWNAMKRAVALALEPLAGILSVGLELYPANSVQGTSFPTPEAWCEMPPDDGTVDVAIDIGTNSVPLITAAMNATYPGGGTPMAEGLRRAYEYFLTITPVEGDPGDRYVLLTTDGGPNCNGGITCDEANCVPELEGLDARCDTIDCCATNPRGCVDSAAVLTQINALQSIGVKTIVVGIPGSEAFATYLDQFAIAGGQTDPDGPRSYYEVSVAAGTDGLDAVFRDITRNLIRSCEIPLEQTPSNVNEVNVAVDCSVVSQGSGAGGSESGWAFDDPITPTSITLTGAICDEIVTNGAERVDVVFGCRTIY
jgi:hypothetical protein